jgi:hypothetical protein
MIAGKSIYRATGLRLSAAVGIYRRSFPFCMLRCILTGGPIEHHQRLRTNRAQGQACTGPTRAHQWERWFDVPNPIRQHQPDKRLVENVLLAVLDLLLIFQCKRS